MGIIAVDTETTGLSPLLGHRIIEIGAVRLETDKIFLFARKQNMMALIRMFAKVKRLILVKYRNSWNKEKPIDLETKIP